MDQNKSKYECMVWFTKVASKADSPSFIIEIHRYPSAGCVQDQDRTCPIRGPRGPHDNQILKKADNNCLSELLQDNVTNTFLKKRDLMYVTWTESKALKLLIFLISGEFIEKLEKSCCCGCTNLCQEVRNTGLTWPIILPKLLLVVCKSMLRGKCKQTHVIKPKGVPPAVKQLLLSHTHLHT